MAIQWFESLILPVLDLLLPPRCEICSTLQEPVICRRCAEQFSSIADPYCLQCGLPLDPLAKTAGHCQECEADPPPFDAARAAGLYAEPLRRAIHVLKYNMVRALALPLGEYAASQISPPFAIDCLCPVPLHPARQRVRGFNQSALLAEQFGIHWELPVEDLLVRTQNTIPQMQLPRAQRRQNVRGAFEVCGKVHGRSIGLIDDVFTTGSTLRECSRMLKRYGAARVLVLTLARTVHSADLT